MVKMNQVHPLTSFLRDHKAHIEELRSTGEPRLLTVNGKASVVVQDAEAFQKMLDRLEAAEAVSILRERIASFERGEPGVPASRVLADVRKRLGIKRGRRA